MKNVKIFMRYRATELQSGKGMLKLKAGSVVLRIVSSFRKTPCGSTEFLSIWLSKPVNTTPPFRTTLKSIDSCSKSSGQTSQCTPPTIFIILSDIFLADSQYEIMVETLVIYPVIHNTSGLCSRIN